MTVILPQRRAFATRDEFAAAVSAAYEDLVGRWEAEPVRSSEPEWAGAVGVYSVALPLAVARDGGDAHGLASAVKHALQMGKSAIGRIARVERDGMWIVFFEAK